MKNQELELDQSFRENFVRWAIEKATLFLEKNDLVECVVLNEAVFKKVAEDAIVDFQRIRDFHGMPRLSYAKLVSYLASWWIRRKPFQVVAQEGKIKPSQQPFVNESFAFTLILCGIEFGEGILKKDETTYLEFSKHLKYHLKYRSYNPQFFELLINSSKDCLAMTLIA